MRTTAVAGQFGCAGQTAIDQISAGLTGGTITLTSASNTSGGYDFYGGTYQGLTGGDFYFSSGDLLANNYNQRGVVDVGACASTSNITTVPSTGYTRFGVAATVGHCYVTHLQDDNRDVVVVRVSALNSTTVTLSWSSLPIPIAQMTWLHCEPYAAPGNIPATTTAATLTNFLVANPDIANAMQWIWPQVSPPKVVPWSQWSAQMQTQLENNFVNYWAWYAGGMVGSDPDPPADPPTNQHTTSGADALTALTLTDARALYTKYLAVTFVVELQHRVAWSLVHYDAASLAELLDSRKFFTGYTSEGYTLIPNTVLPGPPLWTARYVANSNLICNTKPRSIAEAVFWARNLSHYMNSTSPAQDEQDYWQYPGNPPTGHVIKGSVYGGTNPEVPTHPAQWTMGCHGTTGLLKVLLRTINIPVEHFDNLNPTVSQPTNAMVYCGHAVPHFLSEGLWMSHGDDPYIGLGNGQLPYPLSSMLINDAQFASWFPTPVTSCDVPIGRQPDELWIKYGDNEMLSYRWEDLYNTTPPPGHSLDGYINSAVPPNNYYTAAQAQAAGLYTTLDGLLAPYVRNNSSQFLHDSFAVPLYFDPPAQFQAPPCDTVVPQVCAQDSACCNQWSTDCSSESYTLGGVRCNPI